MSSLKRYAPSVTIMAITRNFILEILNTLATIIFAYKKNFFFQ